MAQVSLTKSIDVGSMFLMDLSVNESEQASDSKAKIESDHQIADADDLRNSQQHNHHHLYLQQQHQPDNDDDHPHPHHHHYHHNHQNHHHHHHHHSNKYRKTMISSLSSSSSPKSSANHHDRLVGCRSLAYPTTANSIADHQISTKSSALQQPDYLASSLDRIASIINNCDGQQSELAFDDEHSVTIVQPQPSDYNDVDDDDDDDDYDDDDDDEQEEKVVKQVERRHLEDVDDDNDDDEGQDGDGEDDEPQSSYSLSGESFAISSGTSLSSDSYTAVSERDKASTTTREDSGVLDMKDLEGQLNNSYDNEFQCDNHNYNNNYYNHNQRLEQEKPISNNMMATNLIINSKKLAKAHCVDYQQQSHQQQTNPRHAQRLGKPTDGGGDNNNNDSQNRSSSSSCGSSHHSRRSMSASLPIQVPVRQMRKDLNKMKLKLMKEEQNSRCDIECDHQHNHPHHHHQNHQHQQQQQQQQDHPEDDSSTNEGDHQRPGQANGGRLSLAWDDDDDDAFLDQEFNDNHHNHYPINELDDEHLRAGDDPMRLFASIQALAKSLHEDAELFGSLPPKRLVESPVRSLALV